MVDNPETKEITIFILGVALAFLTWFLDKTGVEMPRWVALALACLCVLMIGWSLSRLGWLDHALPFLRHRISWGSAVITFAAVGFMAWLLWSRLAKKDPDVAPVVPTKTYVRLQFNAAGTYPTLIDEENLFRWYAFTHFFQFDSYDKDGALIKDLDKVKVKSWLVIIVFERPIPLRQVVVDAHGGQLPHYEVKEANGRFMLVYFAGDIVSTAVRITAEN